MVLSGSTLLCVWKRQARDHSAYMCMDFLGKDTKDRGVVVSGKTLQWWGQWGKCVCHVPFILLNYVKAPHICYAVDIFCVRKIKT